MLKVRFGVLIAAFVIFLTGIISAQQDTTDVPSSDVPTRDQEFENDTYQDDDTFQQDQNTTTQAWVDDLSSRLNLTADQQAQLNDILVRYQSESTTMEGTPETGITDRTEVQRRYTTEIESILTENQKTQWRSYSDTWWNSVNTGTTNDGTDFNQDQNQIDTETDIDTDTPRDNTESESETDIR